MEIASQQILCLKVSTFLSFVRDKRFERFSASNQRFEVRMKSTVNLQAQPQWSGRFLNSTIHLHDAMTTIQRRTSRQHWKELDLHNRLISVDWIPCLCGCQVLSLMRWMTSGSAAKFPNHPRWSPGSCSSRCIRARRA